MEKQKPSCAVRNQNHHCRPPRCHLCHPIRRSSRGFYYHLTINPLPPPANVTKKTLDKVWLDPNEGNEISMANSRMKETKRKRCYSGYGKRSFFFQISVLLQTPGTCFFYALVCSNFLSAICKFGVCMLYIMIGIEILGLLTNFWASYTSIRAKIWWNFNAYFLFDEMLVWKFTWEVVYRHLRVGKANGQWSPCLSE